MSPHTDGGFLVAAAGGVAADGNTPWFVYLNIDRGRVQVWKTDLATPGTNLIHDKNMAGTGNKSGEYDLMLGEPGERSDVVHHPLFAFSVCHGLVVAVCTILDYTDTEWRPSGTSVCYWQYDAANALDRGWKVVPFEYGVSQPGEARGASFQMAGYRSFGIGDVLEAWFAFADYVANDNTPSNGGNFYVVRATRASVSGAWNLPGASDLPSGVLKPAYTLPAGVLPPGATTVRLHAHTAYIERYKGPGGNLNGLRLTCAVGDNYPNNRVVNVFCNDESGWANPANWTAQTTPYAHGGRLNATSQNSPVEEGNQFVGAAQAGYTAEPLGQLIGGDESVVPVAFTPPTTGAASDRINFFARFVQQTSSINRVSATDRRNHVFNLFNIRSRSPEANGPFCGQMFPGGQGAPPGKTEWFATHGASRMLYSPNGEHWAHCWAIMHAFEASPAMFGSRIFIGSLSDVGRGTRSIPFPECTVQAPLALGLGGTNRLLSTLPAVSSVPSTNKAEVLTALPAGVQPPPCLSSLQSPNPPAGTLPQVYRCTVPDSSSSAIDPLIGVWRLTSDQTSQLLAASSKIKMRFWVYVMPWAAVTQPIASSLVLDVAVGVYNSADDPAVKDNRERVSIGPAQAVGTWIPVTIDLNSATWSSDADETPGSSPPGASFPLGIRIKARSQKPSNPCDFLLAFDSVVSGTTAVEHPGLPITPASSTSTTTCGPEQAEVTGFSTGSSWTVRLAGEVPHDAWDQMDLQRPTDASGEKLCWFTLRNPTSGKWIKVRPIPSRKVIRFEWDTGESVEIDGHTNEEFFALRNSPLLIGIACEPGTGGSTYRISVSFGSTTVKTVTVTNPSVAWTAIRFGDESMNNLCPMLWYGGKVDETTAVSQTSVEASLRSLGMLFTLVIPYPPSPPDE